jgi:homogentisate 1,2-dioxygenase
LGPIGANGLANPMHFETPVAWFEDKCDWVIHLSVTVKFQGKFFRFD